MTDEPEDDKKAKKYFREFKPVGGFARGKDGTPLRTKHENIRHAIRELDVVLRHNDFSNQSEITGLVGFEGELTDAAAIELRFQIEEKFHFRAPTELYENTLVSIAHRNRYHPVRDYLNSLRWDGVSRIDTWLTIYGGAENTSFHRAIGRLFFIAGVRRIRSPGVKFDTLLVFESAQGLGKSTAARILAVEDSWFSDSLPIGSDSREVIERVSGIWICEFSELSGLGDRETAHVKSFLSRQEDRARPAYGRRLERCPRQFVPLGTINRTLAGYLKEDENRRWWPVQIQQFDIVKLKQDRDQLWAEASHYEALDESLALDQSLWTDAAEAQRTRRTLNPYVEKFQWLHDKEGWVTGCALWDHINVPVTHRFGQQARLFGDALKELGFDLFQIRSRADGRAPRGTRIYIKGDGLQKIDFPRWTPDLNYD